MIGYINVFSFSRTRGLYLSQKRAIKVRGGCRESNAGPLPGSFFADYSVRGHFLFIYPEGRIIPLDHTPMCIKAL